MHATVSLFGKRLMHKTINILWPEAKSTNYVLYEIIFMFL